MKNIIFGIAMAAITLAVLNSNMPSNSESSIIIPSETISIYEVALNTVSTKEIVSSYLQLKNALADDNSPAAATAGKKLVTAFKNFDKSALNNTQKKTFEDVEVDAIENAEHIAANGGKIAHQREHFELLSKDIYDLVKTFGAGQVLYKDIDSMFSNGKGCTTKYSRKVAFSQLGTAINR